jgi:carboxylate-amine ligase
MSKLQFTPNPRPTVGVEIELALVDGQTMALTPAIGPILARLPAGLEESVKPELMQCYLEINTGVCRTISEAEADLRAKVLAVEQATDALGVRLLWSATHPFSLWRDQSITPNERYESLVTLLQDMARQLITFGLHVHVGVDSGDKAIMVCDRILPHLPLLLALSVNSPCWENRITGLQSSRSKVMEGLPTAGLPVEMRNWSEYTWLINHLQETGFINTIREIWWDVRPHHNFGTVEVRICDVPGSLEDALTLAALVQCLVHSLSEEIDAGSYLRAYHPMMVRQNKWRAARYGALARLVDFETYAARPLPELAGALAARLGPTAAALGCAEWLARVPALAAGPSWADRQTALLREVGAAETVRRLTAASRLSP